MSHQQAKNLNHSPPSYALDGTDHDWIGPCIVIAFIEALKQFKPGIYEFSKIQCIPRLQFLEQLYKVDPQCPTIDPSIDDTMYRLQRLVNRDLRLQNITIPNQSHVGRYKNLDVLIRAINIYDPYHFDKNDGHVLEHCAAALARLSARCLCKPPVLEGNFGIEWIGNWMESLEPMLERARIWPLGILSSNMQRPSGPPPAPCARCMKSPDKSGTDHELETVDGTNEKKFTMRKILSTFCFPNFLIPDTWRR
ncbi:hypothetical protein F5Y19DRAFT_478480 [Xylariaceae sp. FL1651]|nr:hypothetical protein F5Y19DRAFT_478480 [Xylariaceae sp. FL1651]